MPFATYDYITIDEILANVKMSLMMDINGNAEDQYLLKHIITCVNEMCTKNQYQEKNAILPIDCFIAELPCDFVKFDRPCPLSFMDGNCGWFTATYTGGPIFRCENNSATNLWDVPVVEVAQCKMYFSHNILATKCQISYYGLVIDDNGKVRVPRTHLRTIENGSAYMYLRAKQFPRGIWQDYKDIWTDGKFDNRGQENMMSSFEKQMLSRTMNSMFPTANLVGNGNW